MKCPEGIKFKQSHFYPSIFQCYPTYKEYKLRHNHYTGLENFYNTPYQRLINYIEEIVNGEGPVHKELVKKRIASAYYIRIGKKISERLNWAISNAISQKRINENGEFLWPLDKSSINLRVSKRDSNKRKLDLIAPEEIMMASIECVRNAISINEYDLIHETSNVFCLRLNNNNVVKIDRCIHFLIEEDILQKRNKRIICHQGTCPVSMNSLYKLTINNFTL